MFPFSICVAANIFYQHAWNIWINLWIIMWIWFWLVNILTKCNYLSLTGSGQRVSCQYQYIFLARTQSSSALKEKKLQMFEAAEGCIREGLVGWVTIFWLLQYLSLWQTRTYVHISAWDGQSSFYLVIVLLSTTGNRSWKLKLETHIKFRGNSLCWIVLSVHSTYLTTKYHLTFTSQQIPIFR